MPRQIWVTPLLVLGTSLCSFATTTTDTEWGITALGGSTVSYDAATGGELVGTGIQVGSIQGQDGSNPTTTPPLDMWGILTFTSGAPTGVWSWGSGSLTISGCVAPTTGADPFAGVGTLNGPVATATGCAAGGSVTLVSATFSSVQITDSFNGTGMGAVMGGLAGTIDVASIASYFGVTPTFTAPPSNGSIPLNGLPPLPPFSNIGAFFIGATSAGNGAVTLYNVPEGWSLFSRLGIFGFGLAAFGVARRFGLIKTVAF